MWRYYKYTSDGRMKKLRFGMSSCGFQDLSEENFEGLQKSGVEELEISLRFNKYENFNYKMTQKRAEKFGINLWSFHLPFQPFETNNISSMDEDVRNNSIHLQSEYIKKAGDIGIGIFVIHPSAEPNREEDRQILLENASNSLIKLADVAESAGGIIAVENLPRTCLGRDAYDISKLISADERLRVCYDTNHLLSQSAKKFIENVGKKIVTTHFSDYDFKDERHWLPGEGKVNWTEIIDSLLEVGYTGPILYELGLLPPQSGTIHLRELTFDDFKENHNSLVNKKPLKVIGAPVWEKCL